jgi:hypothetical protein
MDFDKYKKIANTDPAESFEKSVNTKQAWQKFRNNFKSGMKRRHRIDDLTNNTDDKFNFKEKTKRNYSLSSTRCGQVLNRLFPTVY